MHTPKGSGTRRGGAEDGITAVQAARRKKEDDGANERDNHGGSARKLFSRENKGGRRDKKNTPTSRGKVYKDLGVEVKRSTLNVVMEGGPRKWARAGAREEIIDAGEGLFATKRFQKGEEILDYRYIGGKEVRGDEVEWLTSEQFRRRYPPREGMPEGEGTHVLRSRGKKPT